MVVEVSVCDKYSVCHLHPLLLKVGDKHSYILTHKYLNKKIIKTYFFFFIDIINMKNYGCLILITKTNNFFIVKDFCSVIYH